jgi:TadE-like protein
MRTTRRGRPSLGQRGQALVEFAIVFPLLLIVVFGIIDFGRALQTYITINNASREGARVGSINPGADVEAKVRDAAGAFGDDVGVVVSFPSGSDSGDSVVVDVDYDYTMITPIVGMIATFTGGSLDDTITLSTSSDMRIE